MDNPVDLAQVELRFRSFPEPERPKAQALLDDAWAELQARVPTLGARAAAGQLSPALITRVVAAMVIRVLKNPDAIRQWSIDDASFTRDQLVSGGLLFVTPDEVALLAGGPIGPPAPLAFSVSLGPGRW